MDTSRDQQAAPILCRTCSHYVFTKFKVAGRWCEDQRCVVGMRFAGERTECPYYCREPGSDDE
jgi:hypothetical protein